MKHIPLTKGFVALVDDGDFQWVSQYNWHVKADPRYPRLFYARRDFHDHFGKTRCQFLHRLIMKAPPGLVVDHINGDGLDNRRENLRLCTVGENARNRRKHRNNTSGFTGVYKQGSRYISRIRVGGKLLHVGSFLCPEDAARARDKAALEHFGEFASLNFPEEL
jgi:hypothetical protein